MKWVGFSILVFASLCCAQDQNNFQPAETNVWGAQYPRVGSDGSVQVSCEPPTPEQPLVGVVWTYLTNPAEPIVSVTVTMVNKIGQSTAITVPLN